MTSQSHSKHPLSRRFRGYLPVVVDVETAGFNPRTDALLEVSATTLTMDDNGILLPEHSLSKHLIPFEGANIEKSALEFTKINLESSFRQSIAMDEKEALNEIFKMIRKAIKAHDCTRAILVGHNASFDLGFINAAVDRCNLKRNPFHPFSSFDTATLAALAFGQTVLAKACRAAGIEFDNKEAHSASYDTERTAELFCTVVNTWHELGGWELALRTMPEQV
ncbi:ribonuclease T [Marinospirillum sp.]|uniref:ribonuclease T n=1 Tax=Marinospirillum sp. TaxID=2183934 RepID=UPI00287076A9|nr:ribonuclease T [Marinospirillum sp.]MDR9467777.1 ribonuclease T [Marinospirillum sp.]